MNKANLTNPRTDTKLYFMSLDLKYNEERFIYYYTFYKNEKNYERKYFLFTYFSNFKKNSNRLDYSLFYFFFFNFSFLLGASFSTSQLQLSQVEEAKNRIEKEIRFLARENVQIIIIIQERHIRSK